MARFVEKLSALVLVSAGVAYTVVPERVASVLGPGMALITDGIVLVNRTLPKPLFLGLVLLHSTIAAILIALSAGRGLYVLLKYAGPRTKRAYEFVNPSSPLGKFVLVFSIVVAALLGAVWAIP